MRSKASSKLFQSLNQMNVMESHYRKRCPNNINMDSHDYSLYCDGKTCTMTHSCIWATYTMENIGQYDIFLGHNFPEAFRRINASLDILKRHMAGEIRYDATGTMFFWPPPLCPLSGTTPPSYLYSSNRAAEITYHWNSLS